MGDKSGGQKEVEKKKKKERTASINFPSYYSSIRKKAGARARGNYDLQAIKQPVQWERIFAAD